MKIIIPGNVVMVEPCGQCDSQCSNKICWTKCILKDSDPNCTCLWSRL